MFNQETTRLLKIKRNFLYDLLSRSTDLDLLKVGSTDLQIADNLCIVGQTNGTFQVEHEHDWVLNREEKASFNADVCGSYILRHNWTDGTEYEYAILNKIQHILDSWM